MNKPFVDLHVHSYYSDGSLTPKELANAANENGVGLLALADHDTTEGSGFLQSECMRFDIKTIPAVEIDSVEDGTNFHVLAYGYDNSDRNFNDFLKHTRFLLDESSVKLIELMQKDYSRISIADFMDFTYERRLGGWKALHYFVEKGLTASLKEGIQFYPQYGISYDKSGYSTITAVTYRIKKAGGYSVLAHPGELIDTTNIDFFKNELRRLISNGLDGIECYYPSHSEIVTQACLDICMESNSLITAGSDCHGVFGKTRVGEMNINKDKLILKDLL